mgnify:CR=1 FL=1
MNIRQELPADYDAVYRVVQEAFAGAGHSDGTEQDLVAALRQSGAFVPELSLVAEEDGQALGYAYAHRVAERAAYAWGAELSIYLRPSAAGRGLGRRMYQALMELLAFQGVRTVYGLVASPNPASEGLHRALGFRVMGVQRKAGYKNGRWIDLIWYEKEIGPYGLEPAPIVPIGGLPGEKVREILERYG